jgi:hypothetical protein
MVILSMLPVGLLQAWASIEHGTTEELEQGL